MDGQSSFIDHFIACAQGRVYAREYGGADPAFVLMHGFPDNLHIYDDLIPYLTSGGRRVVAFDFLGFGASDKPVGATYSFRQQLGDLEAVVEGLGLARIVPVAHDASGPAANNFALAHPGRVESLCILNSAYDDASAEQWPEMIELFASKSLRALSGAIAQDPAQFGWLLEWQKLKFRDALPQDQRARFDTVMAPLIADNFLRSPSSGQAFVQMASQFVDELARNGKRMSELAALDVEVKVIWGEFDPYLTLEVGKDRAARFKHGSLRVVPAGHWLQSDLPERVAREMLA